jgi:hypothetical protein
VLLYAFPGYGVRDVGVQVLGKCEFDFLCHCAKRSPQSALQGVGAGGSIVCGHL